MGMDECLGIYWTQKTSLLPWNRSHEPEEEVIVALAYTSAGAWRIGPQDWDTWVRTYGDHKSARPWAYSPSKWPNFMACK